jgi:hypothetical protein
VVTVGRSNYTSLEVSTWTWLWYDNQSGGRSDFSACLLDDDSVCNDCGVHVGVSIRAGGGCTATITASAWASASAGGGGTGGAMASSTGKSESTGDDSVRRRISDQG